ncbi:UNVERIFIED_CONTAM: hypothetical protein PYX00_002854 [Menopon gallinae]|uniref:Uncharacterized protein n=1 Tax=Menopon gallinae TaxID=328185 RepID=A0AAW2HZF7_9NEOP
MTGPCGVCNQPSRYVCGGCKTTNYCSKEHQKLHWKSGHKEQCKPIFRIEVNDVLGRHLVATRDIKAGELILQEPPLIVGPKAVSLPVCLGCHSVCQPGSSVECDGCGFPLCSVKCQLSDHHFDECRLMTEGKYKVKIEFGEKNAGYFPIVPLRCLLAKEKNPEKYKKIINLQSHLEEKLQSPLFALYRKNIAHFLMEKLGLKQFDETEILTVAGILDTNAFEVGSKDVKLRGLYNTASMIAHNCRPNTKHTFHGNDFVMAVTAISDIPAGGVIFATYTQTFWGTLERRNHLKMAKCFDCTCERCSDPSELGTYVGAIRCVNCMTPDNFRNGPYIMSTDPLKKDAMWQCENCGHGLPGKQIFSGNETLKEEISRIDKKNAESLEAFMEKYGTYGAGVLHPRNTHAVQIKHALVQIYGNKPGYLYSELSDELLERKIDYCHELLEIVDVLEPGFSKIRGQLLNELQSAMVMQAKRQFNQGKITKDAAQKILTDSLAILSEAIEILKVEPDMEDLQERLLTLSKELDK